MSNHIRTSLTTVLENYLKAKTEQLKGHPLANLIRQDIPKEFKRLTFIDQDQYEVNASPGQGVWTHVPWIAIMNREITTSTQRGYYIVYLFNEEMESVYLTIAQGVTETSRKEMLKIKEDIRQIHSEHPYVKKDDQINLGESDRARDYEFSTALYIRYAADNLPSEEVLQKDLQEMLRIYKQYIEESRESFPFLEKIKEAFTELNNEAALSELYENIDTKYGNQLSHYTDWYSLVKQTIYDHSSDTNNFEGEVGDQNDLFYAVKGKDKEIWGYRIGEDYNDYLDQLTKPEIINHVYNYIKSKGFYYTKDDITNFYLSLKTKQFVILSGISGTGKTKLAQWFAESIGATDQNGQFTLIPVRPDWSDGSDLLGYIDIAGKFKEGPLTTVMKQAQNNPTLPYIVVLDEMNLARVEYYFSDILSVLESKRWENGNIVTSNVLTTENAGFNMTIPNNVYFIGTVNMDETTYPFSKKVLDRAMTIEFNEIDLGNLSFLKETTEMESFSLSHDRLTSTYLHLIDVYEKFPQMIDDMINELIKINEILEKMQAHVGYRVRDEIAFYMAYNKDADLFTFNQALDYCILQKILPRITGSDARVDSLLKELFLLFTNVQYDETKEDYELELSNARYPKSAKKILEMLRRLDDGFTSFWIS